LQTAYLPISKTAGELLYILVRAMRPATIVEFGTSYGISTLHLAAAVSDNGVGRVVSTELNSAKVTAARANLAETGLSDHVAILPGVQSLENRLSPGALIVADDIILPSMSDYLAYVRNPANGYSTVAFPVEDGMEISCWTARAA
jgi:predicted O-methyltransferase YrrM